jgi:formylglycine-generating enzyme required for sulfatase activity
MTVLEFQPFEMGSNTGAPNESPQMAVNLTGIFAISSHEVTWSQWDDCATDGDCQTIWDRKSAPDHPVAGVSWEEANNFAQWLGHKTNRAYRLPSEVEWEFAAGLDSSDVGGLSIDGSVISPSAISSARSGKPTSAGLYNVFGNVWEWVGDCGLPYQGFSGSAESVQDPAGCTQRVLRGGSWKSLLPELRASYRKIVPATARASDYGFRVAANVEID